MGMKPRMWFTSHSRPPLLWPVIWASTSIPSWRSPQSATSAAALGQAEIVEAVVGVEPLDDHLDGVARLGRLGKLPQGDAALLAAAQFDEHLVAPHGHDAAAVPRFRLEDLFTRRAASPPRIKASKDSSLRPVSNSTSMSGAKGSCWGGSAAGTFSTTAAAGGAASGGGAGGTDGAEGVASAGAATAGGGCGAAGSAGASSVGVFGSSTGVQSRCRRRR